MAIGLYIECMACGGQKERISNLDIEDKWALKPRIVTARAAFP